MRRDAENDIFSRFPYWFALLLRAEKGVDFARRRILPQNPTVRSMNFSA